MYTKEQAIEAVEFLTGQKVERINFKHLVGTAFVDTSDFITPRDQKRVFFICSYDVSYMTDGMSTNQSNYAQWNLNFLDGTTSRIPFYVNHLFPMFSMTYQAGFVVSDIGMDGFSSNTGTWTVFGSHTLVYYECFLSN